MSDSVRVLHDRRIPASRANIDHIVVTTSGVYVIDAKKYRGRPHLKVEGGLVRQRVEKLMVGTRDCSTLVDGVTKQVSIVSSVVGPSTPVRGVPCFLDADWPLIGGSFVIRDVEVRWLKKLYPKLRATGPISTAAVAELHATLSSALPAA